MDLGQFEFQRCRKSLPFLQVIRWNDGGRLMVGLVKDFEVRLTFEDSRIRGKKCIQKNPIIIYHTTPSLPTRRNPAPRKRE